MKKINSLLFLLLLFSLMFFAAITSSVDEISANEISVRSQVDKVQMTTAEQLTLTITINYSPGVTFTIPEFGANIEGLRVVDFGSQGPERSDEDEHKMLSTRWYKLEADLAGTYILPALSISYKDKQGIEKTVKTTDLFIEVTSSAAKSPTTPANPAARKGDSALPLGKDILDIKDLQRLSFFQRYLREIILSSVLFLMIAGIGGGWYWKKRMKKMVSVAPPIPPYEMAEKYLETLKINLTNDLKNHEFNLTLSKKNHFALSQNLRSYLEGEFNISASDMTTDELKNYFQQQDDIDLPQLKLNAEIKTIIINLLKENDLVKFSDDQSSSQRTFHLIEENLKLLKMIRPQIVDDQQNDQNDKNQKSDKSEGEFVV